jgi:hypothetical protein
MELTNEQEFEYKQAFVCLALLKQAVQCCP